MLVLSPRKRKGEGGGGILLGGDLFLFGFTGIVVYIPDFVSGSYIRIQNIDTL